MYRGGVLDYNIPDSYVELEWIQITSLLQITLNNKSTVNYECYLTCDGEDYYKKNTEFIRISGSDYYLCSYCNAYGGDSYVYNSLPYFSSRCFYKGDTVKINITCINGKMSCYINDKLKHTLNAPILSGNNILSIRYRSDNYNYKIHYLTIIESSSLNVLHHFIPVRRLGDGVCGLFDTINQKFYSSTSNKQFIGGTLKTIKNELDASYIPDYITLVKIDHHKYNGYLRLKKSLIMDAYYSNGYFSRFRVANNNPGYLYFRTTMRTPYYNDSIDQTGALSAFRETNQIFYNINPNFRIYLSDGLDLLNYEINNQNIILNKNMFNVYNTGTTTPAEDDGFL